MKTKKLKLNIDSTYKYLQLWNGIFNLTNKELSILSAFIDTQTKDKDINLCSNAIKKTVASIIGIKDPNTLNNYIKKYKDKRAIIKKDKIYSLNPMLDPTIDVVEITIVRNV
tara:strand:- start:1142 stop:1477 length:336 start_codon:yes stop_codon:yes gene_type:complete